jgi:hypothetical protein
MVTDNLELKTLRETNDKHAITLKAKINSILQRMVLTVIEELKLEDVDEANQPPLDK